MPNHYTTIGLFLRDYNKLRASGKQDFNFEDLDNADLCERVCPFPDELLGISVGSTTCRYRHKQTGEFSKDPNIFGNDDYETVELTEEEKRYLLDKYGAFDWYDWCTENWGTKWGTYDTKVYELSGDCSPVMIEFCSAWSPPKKEIMDKIVTYLHDNYYIEHRKWVGFDPSDGDIEDL